MKKYRRVMSHDTEKWSKEKLIIGKCALFAWCNRLEAVSGRYSWSVGKIFENSLGWSSFLWLIFIPLVPQTNPSIPKVSPFFPPRQSNIQNSPIFLLTSLFWGYLISQIKPLGIAHLVSQFACNTGFPCQIDITKS